MTSVQPAKKAGTGSTGAGYALVLLGAAVSVALFLTFPSWPRPLGEMVTGSRYVVPLLAGLLTFGVGWAVLGVLGVPIVRRPGHTPPPLQAGLLTEAELEQVRDNARAATTEDLLDRVTAYRGGMEPQALRVIEEELATRGIDTAAILQHEGKVAAVLRDVNGVALTCSYCRRPAVGEEEADSIGLWAGLLTDLPLDHGPRRYCEEHRPRRSPAQPAD